MFCYLHVHKWNLTVLIWFTMLSSCLLYIQSAQWQFRPPLRLRPQLYVSDSFLYIFNVIPSSAKTNNSQIRTLFIFNSLHLRKGSVYTIKTRNICMSSSVLQLFKSITIILSFSTKSWLKNIGVFIKHLSYSQISFDLFIMYYIRTNKLPPC